MEIQSLICIGQVHFKGVNVTTFQRKVNKSRLLSPPRKILMTKRLYNYSVLCCLAVHPKFIRPINNVSFILGFIKWYVSFDQWYKAKKTKGYTVQQILMKAGLNKTIMQNLILVDYFNLRFLLNVLQGILMCIYITHWSKRQKSV